MLLPSDDTVELDESDDGPLIVDKHDPIARTLEDQLKFSPAYATKGTSAPRDAFLQTWGHMANTSQARNGFVLAAQASPRFAEGEWLDYWGQLLTKPRTPHESDPDYRARLLIPIDVVSPNAIKAAVNAVATQFTAASIIYNEPAVDAMFCGPATTSDPAVPNARQQTTVTLQTWQAFVQPQQVVGGTPLNQTVYVDKNFRLWAEYGDDDVLTGAFATPTKDPVYPGGGPQFWITIPGEIGDDSTAIHCVPEYAADESRSAGHTNIPTIDAWDYTTGITSQTTMNQSAPGIQGTPASTSYVYAYVPASPDSLFDKINIEVTRRRPGGVPWLCLIDLPVSSSF